MWRIFVPEFPKVEGEGSRCLSFSIPLLFCIPLLFNFPLLLRRVLLSSSGEHSSPHQNHVPPPRTHMHTHAHTRTHNAHILILLLKLEHTLGPRPVSHAVLHNGRLRLASRSWLRSGSLRDVAPFGTDYVAKSLAAMAARDFVKELLLSTSRPSRRSGIFCAERSRPLDQSSSSRAPSWYNQLAPRGLLGPLGTSRAPPSRPPGA